MLASPTPWPCFLEAEGDGGDQSAAMKEGMECCWPCPLPPSPPPWRQQWCGVLAAQRWPCPAMQRNTTMTTGTEGTELLGARGWSGILTNNSQQGGVGSRGEGRKGGREESWKGKGGVTSGSVLLPLTTMPWLPAAMLLMPTACCWPCASSPPPIPERQQCGVEWQWVCVGGCTGLHTKKCVGGTRPKITVGSGERA